MKSNSARHYINKAEERENALYDKKHEAELTMWLKCCPLILATFTDFIKKHPLHGSVDFVASLPSLREKFKQIRDKQNDFVVSQRHVKEMCELLNKFNNDSGIKLLLCKKEDPMLKIPSSMWIGFKDSAKWYKLNEALERISRCI